MAIYAISDLHLALSTPKPMDVFGDGWFRYMERIEEAWRAVVMPEDYVLIPGDVSWATYIDAADKDFEFLDNLPGRKVISKGNHDYWWTTTNKMRQYLEDRQFKTISFLHNDAILIENVAVVAARGWVCPGMPDFRGAEDEKIYQREIIRLRLSIAAITSRELKYEKMVVMLHYPPFSGKMPQTAFTEIIKTFEPDLCIFGHLHGVSARAAFEGTIGKTRFIMVSADHLQFQPYRID